MTWVKKIELGDFLEAVRMSAGKSFQLEEKPSALSMPSTTVVSEASVGKQGRGDTQEESFQTIQDIQGAQGAQGAQNTKDLKSIQAIQKENFEKLMFKIQQDFEGLLHAVQGTIPTLLMKLLRKILGAYTWDAKALHSLIEDVLKEVSEDNGYVEIFISPGDWETLSLEDAAWASHYPRVSFFKDDKLIHGDCVLKSRFGMVDGRLEKKLEKIQKELALK